MRRQLQPSAESRRAVRRATLREVAVMAGVHPATASRALNEQTESLVNAETAARIKKVAAEIAEKVSLQWEQLDDILVCYGVASTT